LVGVARLRLFPLGEDPLFADEDWTVLQIARGLGEKTSVGVNVGVIRTDIDNRVDLGGQTEGGTAEVGAHTRGRLATRIGGDSALSSLGDAIAGAFDEAGAVEANSVGAGVTVTVLDERNALTVEDGYRASLPGAGATFSPTRERE